MDEREITEKTEAADGMLAEDERRLAELSEKWNPITGEGSRMERVRVEIVGFPLPAMWVPRAMMDVPLVSSAAKVGVDGVQPLHNVLCNEGLWPSVMRCRLFGDN